MELKEKAVELFKSTATMMPTQIVQKAASSLADSKTPNGVKVPILTNDPEVQRFVDEFELYKPEKMVQFLIQGGFAQFECIMDAVNELKEIDLINSHSFIKAAQRHYKRAMANESKFEAEAGSTALAQIQLEGNDNAIEFLQNTFKDKGIGLDAFTTMIDHSRNIKTTVSDFT